MIDFTRVRSGVCAAALSGLLTACTSPEPTDGVPGLDVLWTSPHKTVGYSSLHGDLILAGTDVRAIDLRARTLAFGLTTEVDLGRTSFASVGDDLLLVERDQPRLRLIDRQGRLRNTVELPGSSETALGVQGPVVTGDALYVVYGNTLYKFRASELGTPGVQPLWQRTVLTDHPVMHLFVLDEDHVYVAAWDNRVLALDADGHTRWSVPLVSRDGLSGIAESMAAWGESLIVVGASELQALDLRSGELRWRTSPGRFCPSGAGVTARQLEFGEGRVFMGLAGGSCVAAFDLADGRVAWVFDAPNSVTFNSRPVYLRGVVYATNSNLWALDARTGRPLGVSKAFLGGNLGTPVHHDAVRNQILHWGNTGLIAFKPLR